MAQPKAQNTKTGLNINDEKDADVDTFFDGTLSERIAAFEKNICEFPLKNNKITSKEFKGYRQEIYFHMKHAYPLVHGGILSLVYHFLLIKKKYGSSIEKTLYENMTMTQFFHRIATKRAIAFVGSSDTYLLRNGSDGAGKWQLIGTEKEQNISIKDYLSYDELLISAMCGISSPTHFLNNGSRGNCGRIQKLTWNEYYPSEAIYMGLIGARFERNNVMENALMAVNPYQNTKANGYGPFTAAAFDGNDEKNEKEKELNDDLFLQKAELSEKNNKNNKVIWRAFEEFYGVDYLPCFDEINNKFEVDHNDAIKQRYFKREGWRNCDFLDMDIYKRRISISLELFLFDADYRAKQYKQMYANHLPKDKLKGAYCHIVGLGTGVWSFEKREQNRIIVEAAAEIINNTNLRNIDCVYFSWIGVSDEVKEEMFDSFGGDEYYLRDVKGHAIGIKFGRREPADELEEPYTNCLTVAMFAWDSNAFVGNEYYHRMLSASGDPAAASCSTISFVQNSEINKEYITGENAGIYFYDQQTQDYEFYKLGEIDFEKNKEKWLKKSILSIPYKRNKFKNL